MILLSWEIEVKSNCCKRTLKMIYIRVIGNITIGSRNTNQSHMDMWHMLGPPRVLLLHLGVAWCNQLFSFAICSHSTTKCFAFGLHSCWCPTNRLASVSSILSCRQTFLCGTLSFLFYVCFSNSLSLYQVCCGTNIFLGPCQTNCFCCGQGFVYDVAIAVSLIFVQPHHLDNQCHSRSCSSYCQCLKFFQQDLVLSGWTWVSKLVDCCYLGKILLSCLM